jgi:hypothetical protein
MSKPKKTPRRPKSEHKRTEFNRWVDEFNSKNDPHNLGAFKPGQTKIVAGGTGFNTAGKKAPKASPKLQKLSDELGLSPKVIAMLYEKFGPKK